LPAILAVEYLAQCFMAYYPRADWLIELSALKSDWFIGVFALRAFGAPQ